MRNIIAALFAGLVVLTATGSFAKDAKVRINVKPSQAYVFVDGSTFGHGSRTIEVAPGKHTIGVYNYGFAPQVRELSLDAGRNATLEFNLVAVPGSVTGPWGRLQIEGPSSASVYLNGKTPDYFVGHVDEFNNSGEWLNCCTQQLIVPAGTHQVTIIDVKAKPVWSGSVDVPANKRVVLYAHSGEQKVKPWPEAVSINSLSRFKAGIASATIAIPPVTGSINADAAQINCGDSSRVAWQTAEAVQRDITADSETLNNLEPSGNVTVQPKKTTTYMLRASGPGGAVTSSANVSVNTTVQSSIQASPAEVQYRRIGDKVLRQASSNLTWNATNAQSLSIDPMGTVGSTGSQTVQVTPKQNSNGPINEVQTYTLTAKNECGGLDTQTANVRIIGSIEPIPEIPLASVFFPTGYPDHRHPKVGLVTSQKRALDRTAAGFKKYLEYDPDARLSIAGNTDERDSNAKNKPLSARRANVVKDYLVSQGIPSDKIVAVANGKTKQLTATTVQQLHDSNPNKVKLSRLTLQELGWAYNRRADITLLPKNVLSQQYFPGDAPEAAFLADSNWPGQKEILVQAAEKTPLPTGPGTE